MNGIIIDQTFGIILLAIACVIGNTFVACTWLREFYRNPQAGSPMKYVLLACATSEFLAIVCTLKLLLG